MTDRPLSPAVQKLIAKYREALPERLQELREQGLALNDAEALHAYEREVHKLAGSSGSYGFRDLSEALRDLDRLLRDCHAEGQALDPSLHSQLWTRIDQALAALSSHS